MSISYPRWLYRKSIEILRNNKDKIKDILGMLFVVAFGMVLPIITCFLGALSILKIPYDDNKYIPLIHGIPMLLYSLIVSISWFVMITYRMYKKDIRLEEWSRSETLEEWDRRQRRRWRQSP